MSTRADLRRAVWGRLSQAIVERVLHTRETRLTIVLARRLDGRLFLSAWDDRGGRCGWSLVEADFAAADDVLERIVAAKNESVAATLFVEWRAMPRPS